MAFYKYLNTYGTSEICMATYTIRVCCNDRILFFKIRLMQPGLAKTSFKDAAKLQYPNDKCLEPMRVLINFPLITPFQMNPLAHSCRHSPKKLQGHLTTSSGDCLSLQSQNSYYTPTKQMLDI